MVTETTQDRSGELQRFWQHLFGNEHGLLQVFTGVREGGRLDNPRFQFFAYPGAIRTAAEWALDRAEEGREVYFCAHLLTSSRRIKKNAAAVRTLWGEIDGGNLPNGELKPTALVQSSPGKYHVYWRLDDAIPPEIAEGLNRRIAAEIGADPSGFDLTQLLRVPGTTNHKYDDTPQVTLVGLEGGRSYSAADLDEILPASEKPKAEYVPTEDADEPPVVLDPEAMRVWRGEAPKLKEDGTVDRSASIMNIGRKLYDAGATRPTITTALQERDEALGWKKYTGNRDGGQREYERIYEKLEKEGRNRRVRVIVGGGGTQAPKPEWPKMNEAAYRGLFGEVVELVEPHTEADPVAVLVSQIVAFGSAMGRGPYVEIGATKHRTNMNCGIVGNTAKGRKGSSWNPVKHINHAADKRWTEDRILSGLSSGEGLISEVRDPIEVPGKDGKMEVVDQGVKDKRLL
ncbi:MAG: RepB family DNA primase, partial [Actinomycetota bacterium]|nr:RepB family DNA primase [Actinomycetota bacterium]